MGDVAAVPAAAVEMAASERLRLAIAHDKLAVVRRLVRRYPDLLENVDAANGWSSLHYAGYHGRYEICVFLVQQGHDREEISLAHDRSTPLHLAASQNHEQTVHFLAQHIPRSLNWVNADRETALMVATRHGHDPSINLLLDFGADIDRPGKAANRPIHIAAAYGHVKTLRTLVERGADVQTPNAEGLRPVQYCSNYQVQDYLQSLIHEKSEADKRRRAGPLVPAASPGSIGSPTPQGTHQPSGSAAASAAPSLGPAPTPSLGSAAILKTSPNRDIFPIGGVIAANASTESLPGNSSQLHLPSFTISARQPSSNSSSNSSLPGSSSSLALSTPPSGTHAPAPAASHPNQQRAPLPEPPSPSPRRKPVRNLTLNLDKPLPAATAVADPSSFDPPITPVNQMAPPVIPPRKGSLGQHPLPLPKFPLAKSASASPSSSSASVASSSSYGTPKKYPR